MVPDMHFGPDSLLALTEALRARGSRRVMIISGASRRFVDRAVTALQPLGVEVEVFDGAKVHVPMAVVAAAERVADRFRPDAMIAVGGGAATGLGKVLRRTLDSAFFAVPTTFSGSEMTSIFGTTDGQKKETGRDPRVRPDGVFYVPAFLQALPLPLKTTSLLNALAHPISALSTGSLEAKDRSTALEAIRLLVKAALQLAETPCQVSAHEDGLRGAAKAGQVLEAGPLGVHHRAAHFLGGRFALEHSALHAVLLPHTVGRLATEQPDLFDEVTAAAQLPDLPAQLFDLLRRVGAKTSLRDLDVSFTSFGEALAEPVELPADLMQAAFHGRRPSVRSRTEDWGLRMPVALTGASLSDAKVVVVAVHGRHANAESMVGRVLEVAGHGPQLAVVAPQAPNNEWYAASYRAPASEIGAPLATAMDELQSVIDRARASAPGARLVLFGFSQGACLAAELVAARGVKVDALISLAGSRIGPRDGYSAPSASIDGVPALFGIGRGDAWVTTEDTSATAKWFERAGAQVDLLVETASAHQMAYRQRIRAREIIFGAALGTQRGYGNAHETEALAGALPPRMNSPRRVRYGLYAEQINGTGFVAKRHENLRSWTYRIRPAAQHTPFVRQAHPTFNIDFDEQGFDPNLLGYAPLPIPGLDEPVDFVDGMATFGGAGHPEVRRGFALHVYVANRSMEQRAFSNADGEMLIVPQEGRLTLVTEMGILDLPPGKVAIVPRGIKFSVVLHDEAARGYVAEAYGRHFELPERGPVGANGLTEARHFLSPEAWYEDRLAPGYRLTNKFCGEIYEATQDYSPYDIVAWHGNYTPYVYDLMDFGPVANVRYDHPDPSIYSVLSAPMDEQGSHTLDFVFFPPRWDTTEGTFRPPFFHRNATTEFNGIIKDPGGDKPPFYAGGYFMTPSMTGHGVMADSVLRTMLREDDPPPHRSSESSMWFQFESALPIRLTRWAKTSANRMADWHELWGAYRTHFDPGAL